MPYVTTTLYMLKNSFILILESFFDDNDDGEQRKDTKVGIFRVWTEKLSGLTPFEPLQSFVRA